MDPEVKERFNQDELLNYTLFEKEPRSRFDETYNIFT